MKQWSRLLILIQDICVLVGGLAFLITIFVGPIATTCDAPLWATAIYPNWCVPISGLILLSKLNIPKID